MFKLLDGSRPVKNGDMAFSTLYLQAELREN